jgi:hypothetical protein
LVRIALSNSSGSISASGAGNGPSVALLKAASSLPKVSSARSTSRSTEAASPTSVGTTRVRPPSFSIPSATSSRARWSRAASTTAAPARANACAVTAPMPRLAPAIRATLPASGGVRVVSELVMFASPPLWSRAVSAPGAP